MTLPKNEVHLEGTIPFDVSGDASSTHQFPVDIPDSDIPDSVVDDTEPNGHRGPINEEDIVIAIMGLTGAGKSSFVRRATGSTQVPVGHDLMSQTRRVHPVRCTRPGSRQNVVLVDTPGFDDTVHSDAKILSTIAKWLKETYQNNITLAGILYLHRISDVRMAGTPLRNLTVFRDLCGDDNLKNIILVTTMWDELDSEIIGSEREEELVSDFWSDMVRLGSRTCRYHGNHDSAWEIIDRLDLERSFQRRAPLQIQREMVDRGVPLHETAAAKTLLRSLGDELKKVWEKLRSRARRPIFSGRPSGSFRKAIFRRSSIKSNASIASRSVISLADSASIASGISTRPSSIAESTASSCSSASRREALSAMIKGLKIAYEVAELVPVPMLRGAIKSVLSISTLIEEMSGAHHTISQVVENSGWLLEEMTRYAQRSPLSEDMKKALNTFARQAPHNVIVKKLYAYDQFRELKHLQNIVKKFEGRRPVARFLLHDADIIVITQCNTAIKTIYDKLGTKIAMDNYHAIVRLQDEMVFLRNNNNSRHCPCSTWAVPEESDVFYDASSSR